MCIHAKHSKKISMRKLIPLIKLLYFFFISYEVDQRARDFDRTMIIELNITVSTDIFNDKTRNHFMFMPKVTTNILLCVKFWLNLVTPLSKRTLVLIFDLNPNLRQLLGYTGHTLFS